MTDLDLERLGDVWRQRPEPGELEEIKRAAEAVRRRARWLQVVDVLAALAVGGVVLFLIISNPKTDTLIVGGGAIVVLLLGQIRSRRFRQQELRSLTGSAEQMLDQSIERVEAAIKRARSGLIIFLPCVLLGLLVGYAAGGRSSANVVREAIIARPALAQAITVVAVVALVAGVVQVVRALRKNRRELARLTALRASYREDDEAADG